MKKLLDKIKNRFGKPLGYYQCDNCNLLLVQHETDSPILCYKCGNQLRDMQPNKTPLIKNMRSDIKQGKKPTFETE